MFLIFTTFLVINNLFFVFQESNESAQVRITDLAMITVSKEEHYIVIIFLIAVLIGLNLQPNCVLTSGTMLLWASTKSFKELLFIFILNLCRCLLKVTRIRLVGTGLYSLYVIITSNLNTIIEREKNCWKISVGIMPFYLVLWMWRMNGINWFVMGERIGENENKVVSYEILFNWNLDNVVAW